MSESLNKRAGKAGLWYTVGNILLKGCVFFTLPIFTRLLSTEDFGIYNTYIAYEGLISAFLGLGLYGTVKNAKLDYPDRFDEYISSVFSLSVIVLFTVILLANALYPLYSSFIGFSRFIVNCLLLQSFGTYFIHFYGTKLNVEFRYKPFLAISIANTLGSIAVSILLIVFVFPQERYLGRIIGSASLPITIAFIVGGLVLLHGKRIIAKEYWKYAAAIGLPLVPHVVSQSLLSQFDRIMISNMVGNSQAGIYSYLYTICTITNVICLSLDNAWTPWLFFNIKDKKMKVTKKASRKYIEGFGIITLGFICVMPEVTKVIAPSNYWEGIDLLVPLALSNFCIFLYLMPVSIEYYNKKTAYISIGTVGAALLNLTLNYFGIKLFGYKAAAYTTLISYFVLFVLHAVVATRLGFKQIIDFSYIIKVALVIVGASFLILASNVNSILFFISRTLVLLFIIIYLWSNRKVLISIISNRGNRG